MANPIAKSCWAILLFIGSASGLAADRPNVLLIAVDDLNDWVGPLGGHKLTKTPNFDRLAAQGTTFTNAHCQAPLCNPSRTSLMLSLRPSTTGIYALEPAFHQVPELKDRVPLFQYFKSNGYSVYSVGKLWHAGIPKEQQEREFTELGPTGKLVPPEKPLAVTPSKHPLVDWGPFPERQEEHYDYQTADWAVAKLKSRPRGPFVLAVGFSLPHVPCYAPQKWFDLYPHDASLLPPIKDDDRHDVPPFAWHLHWRLPEPRLKWLRESDQLLPLTRAYLASISLMDAQVGRLLDVLQESQQQKNTIVVLWSDHGWHLGEKGISGKNTLWERSTHVPLIFAGPGIVQGKKIQQPAELLDVYPTLIELCGLPSRNDLEGQSLSDQLRGESDVENRVAITSHGPGNHAVRSATMRYIRYADSSEELYDLAADPNEWRNLAGVSEYAQLMDRLAKHLPVRSAPPVPGSKSRLVELKNGTVYWETKPIGKDDSIPE